MFGLGAMEILIIAGAALVFIGPKKLPGLARNLGKGFREFQNAARGLTEAVNEPMKKSVEDIKKDLPSWEEQYKDDPPHDMGDDSEVVRPEDLNHDEGHAQATPLDQPQLKEEDVDKSKE